MTANYMSNNIGRLVAVLKMKFMKVAINL